MKGIYIAIVHKDPDSAYGVTLPDFPGCYGADDDSARGAIENAAQGLALYVEDMLSEGEDIPAGKTFEEWREDPEFRKAAEDGVVAYVPLLMKVGKPKRFTASIDENTLALIDREAGIRGLTRSAFLAEAARRMVVQKGDADR